MGCQIKHFDGMLYASFPFDVVCSMTTSEKLEDLKVLRRSPDLINNVKIVKVNYAYNKTFCFTIYGGCSHFGQVT